jgi:hypothetical protein
MKEDNFKGFVFYSTLGLVLIITAFHADGKYPRV